MARLKDPVTQGFAELAPVRGALLFAAAHRYRVIIPGDLPEGCRRRSFWLSFSKRLGRFARNADAAAVEEFFPEVFKAAQAMAQKRAAAEGSSVDLATLVARARLRRDAQASAA